MPLIHFPHCKVRITTTPVDFSFHSGTQNTTTTSDNISRAAAASAAGKIEQIALPGTLVRTLLSRLDSSLYHRRHHQQQQPPPPCRQEDPDRSPTTPQEASTTATGLSSGSTSEDTPQITSTPSSRIQRHFDDDDEWVFSRCLLADFTGLREDEAEALSSRGSLCCWASVVLHALPGGQGLDEDEDGDGTGESGARWWWDLGFVVYRVGVRDPRSGWCECF
ncbi:hypothetical protein VTK56DRAFT_1706 [Thermocarpiscus australiensis]